MGRDADFCVAGAVGVAVIYIASIFKSFVNWVLLPINTQVYLRGQELAQEREEDGQPIQGPYPLYESVRGVWGWPCPLPLSGEVAASAVAADSRSVAQARWSLLEQQRAPQQEQAQARVVH